MQNLDKILFAQSQIKRKYNIIEKHSAERKTKTCLRSYEKGLFTLWIKIRSSSTSLSLFLRVLEACSRSLGICIDFGVGVWDFAVDCYRSRRYRIGFLISCFTRKRLRIKIIAEWLGGEEFFVLRLLTFVWKVR